VKIALDAMGGDLAPKAPVEGAVMAARDFGIEVVLVGDRDIIARELAAYDTANLPIRIEPASETILMDDSPLEAVIAKPRSSMHVGLELVKIGAADAFVSAGNSGAQMAASMMVLGNLAGVDRPAIASVVPAAEGLALLVDAGANTDVKPINLVQFAIMASVYWRHVRNVSRPRVGILSNGEEASKGTDLTRAAAAILEQMPSYLNYIGYVEGRDINRGKADVIVTDGFTGNVALKTMEGMASFMLGNLRELFGGSWRGRVSYLLIRKYLTAMRTKLDPHEYGGAPLLGVAGVSIIAHGSSNAVAIRNAVRAASHDALVKQVNAEILDLMARIQPAVPVKQAGGKGIRTFFAKMRERLQRHPKEGDAAKSVEVQKVPDPVRTTESPSTNLEQRPRATGELGGARDAAGARVEVRPVSDTVPATNGKVSSDQPEEIHGADPNLPPTTKR
jgi:phosphate acyltransferase